MYDYFVVKKGGFFLLIFKLMFINFVKYFGISDKKGFLNIGVDVDIVLLVLDKEWKIISDSLKYLNK